MSERKAAVLLFSIRRRAASAAFTLAVWGLAALGAWTAAAAEPTPADRAAIEAAAARPDQLVLGALETIYAAFEAFDEEETYDRLASVAAEPVVEDLYLRHRAGLVARDAEGARQALHGLTLESLSSRRDGDALTAEARWRVLGVVAHATHLHMRGAAFAARLRFEPGGDTWRVAGFELLDVDRRGVGDIVAGEPAESSQDSEEDG